MTDAALPAAPPRLPGLGWMLAIGLFLAFAAWGAGFVPWAFALPRGWEVPFDAWIGGFVRWLLNEAHFGLFTFAEFTRFVAAVLQAPYRLVLGLLSTGWPTLGIPPLPWVAVVALSALAGQRAGGPGLGGLLGGDPAGEGGVLGRGPEGRGGTVRTLRGQEIGRRGTLGKPQVVDALGRQIYFEALVIKFQTALVGEGDPSRGHSLAMFRRVYGDQQAPESAPDIDRASRPPLDDPRDSDALHDRLWALFWKMTEDPAVAAQYGVRVAQSEAPSVRVEPGQFWQVSLDASGGLNLSRLMSRAAP